MKNKAAKSKDPYRVEATSANDLDGCATTEATGLIPTMPESNAEINAYKEILPFSPDCYVQKTSDREDSSIQKLMKETTK